MKTRAALEGHVLDTLGHAEGMVKLDEVEGADVAYSHVRVTEASDASECEECDE